MGMPISGQRFEGMAHDRLQHQPAIVGHDAVTRLEEVPVSLLRECLEGLDADDAIDRLVELLPTAQEHLAGTFGVEVVQKPVTERVLVPAQRQAHDVDVVALDGAFHHRTPAAADIQQSHPWPQIQLAERQVDLG